VPPSILAPASPTPPPSRWGVGKLIKLIVSLSVVFCLAYALLSFQVPISQLSYASAKPSPNPPGVTIVSHDDLAIPSEATLNIPKLNIHAPVIYGSANDDTSFQKSLEHGVVHYSGTALPGEVGNVVIFGHSSNDWWEPGDYKFVFVLLDKLAVGDKIGIDYQSKRHYYVVTDMKVVEPNQTGVMAPTAVPTLTLITCTPPGTSLKRLVVRAREANPALQPAVAASPATTPPEQSAKLIGSNSFMSKVRNVFVGVYEWFVPAS
jgi:LPXTG-site transpeptidase (sortase) family protein